MIHATIKKERRLPERGFVDEEVAKSTEGV